MWYNSFDLTFCKIICGVYDKMVAETEFKIK